VWNALDANSRTISLADLMRAHDESVWSKAGLLGIPSPFAQGFDFKPTDDLIARIQRLGTPVEAPLIPKRRAARNKPPTVREVLSAS
jgi:hypothetical protein